MDNMENKVETPEVEAAPVAAEAPAKEKKSFMAVVNGITAKIVNWVKTTPPKKLITLGCIVLTAAIVLGVGIGLICHFTNYYMTPIYAMEKRDNMKEYDLLKQMKLYSNGLAYSEAKALYNVLKDVDYVAERLEENKDAFDENYIEYMNDRYGDDWKTEYKVEDKDELEKEDLKAFKEYIKLQAEYYIGIAKRCKDYDSDDWEEICEEYDITKAEAKEILEKFEDLARELKDVKVTAGYELDVTMTTVGSEDDYEESGTICVYEVNGKWVYAFGNSDDFDGSYLSGHSEIIYWARQILAGGYYY